MNQILYRSIFEFNNNDNKNNKNKTKFFIIILVAIILIIIAFCLYLFNKYNLFQNDKISKQLISNYNIMTLYSTNTNNDEATFLTQNREPFVIGLIQIDEIKLTYPILSTTNEELLKISPCRFAGPMPNQVGNLCIAGHNYVDNKLFSKINLLEIGNIIKIFDLSGNIVEYKIYDKKEIKYDDFSCALQNTNGKREVTLLTCNNVSGNRVCIKAVE